MHHFPGKDEDDDEGIFEIQDFSIATRWEMLIAAVEDALRGWLGIGEDEKRPEQIVQLDMEDECFKLILVGGLAPATTQQDHARKSPSGKLPQFMAEMLDDASDFSSVAFSESKSEKLKRWFGLSTFALLVPEAEWTGPDQMAALQGALSVALCNCGCECPAFVLHDHEKTEVCGRAAAMSVGVGGGVSASSSLVDPDDGRHALGCRFDVALLPIAKVPTHLLSASGVVAFFCSKLRGDDVGGDGLGQDWPDWAWSGDADDASAPDRVGLRLQREVNAASIRLSRRHTYILPSEGWPSWKRVRSGPSSSLEIEIGGATSDPLPSMTLAAQWVCTGDVEAIEEGVERPEAAQRLSLRVLEQSIPSRVPGTALETRVGQLLADLLACAEAVERAPHAEEGEEEGRGDRSSCRGVLRLMLGTDARQHPLSSADVASGLEAIVEPEPTGAAGAAARSHGSSAGAASLLQRLVICALNFTTPSATLSASGRRRAHGACALLQLWDAVLSELRRRWELNEPLPHVCDEAPAEEEPNGLQQLLQLLSYSMAEQRRMAKEHEWEKRRGEWRATRAEKEEAEKEEAEKEEAEKEEAENEESTEAGAEEAEKEVTTAEGAAEGKAGETGPRVGARFELPGLKGAASGQPLWAPWTRAERVVRAVLLEARRQRTPGAARAERASRLKRGMQAFKAANPGCVLADFCGWWRLEQRRGDNGGGGEGDAGGADDGADDELLAVLWAATLPVPASQQRPLFDAEREAHDALEELAEVPPSQLLRDLQLSVAEGAIACLRASPLFCLLSAHAKQRAADALREVKRLHVRHADPNGELTRRRARRRARISDRRSLPSSHRTPPLARSVPHALLDPFSRHAFFRSHPARASVRLSLASAEWRARVLTTINLLEREIEKAASLASKLPDHPDLVAALLADPSLQTEAEVPESSRAVLAKRVYDGHGDGGGLIDDAWIRDAAPPEPDLSEYILRAEVPRPDMPGAMPVVHRMYVARRPPDQWRLAVALSIDHAV